jgi:glutathione synthase
MSLRIGLIVNNLHVKKYKNNFLLVNALYRKGFSVYYLLSNSIALKNNDVTCVGTYIEKEVILGDDFHDNSKVINLNDLDCLWLLGTGNRTSYLDRIEILWVLIRTSNIRLINSLDAITFMNNKYCLSGLNKRFHYPESYYSSSFQELWEIYSSRKNENWIVKPPAGMLGRNVFLLKPNDTNAKVILESMVANNRFCVLQKYIKQIRKNGEKRVVISGGKIICHYNRLQGIDHRTNLYQGAHAQLCNLGTEEKIMLEDLGQHLLKYGVYFVGVDIVYPYIIELNIINPGGLNTSNLLANGFDVENLDEFDKSILPLLKIDFSDLAINSLFDFLKLT